MTGDSKLQKDKNIFNEFIKEIKIMKLNKYFLYLGKVPYSDLINLINQSKALINPSLFEGWSTSIEETKILNKDNIAVKYQGTQRAKSVFLIFNPKDDLRLSKIIYKVITNKISKTKKI